MATSVRDLNVDLKYLAYEEKYNVEKPFTCLIDLGDVPGAEQTNIVSTTIKNVLIQDIRATAEKLDIDVHGFELSQVHDHFHPESFEDKGWMQEVYYPHLEETILKKFGATKVHVFEHQLRYRHPGFGQPYTRGARHYDPPLSQVHIDQTPAAAIARFRKHWPGFTEELLNHRLQIINVWRPLNDKVEEWPLALCDFQSVDAERDLVKSDIITNDYVGESFVAHYNSSHSWMYVSEQTFKEAWIIKIFDSDTSVANAVLHTGLDIGESQNARKSVETRLLVKY